MKSVYSLVSTVIVAVLLLLFLSPAQGADLNKPQPINVQVVTVSSADLPKQISSLGSLVAPQLVTLSAEAAGRIKQINFKNGQTVGKGMPVLQLDDTSAEVDYQKAVATLNADSVLLARQLKAAEALAQSTIDASKATVDQDKADVKSKQAALNQMTVSAPISGVLGNFQVNVGDYLKAGDPIVTLVNTKQLRVDYNVTGDALSSLKRGQTVIVTVDNYPNKKFMGSVTYISPTVDPSTRTIAVQALIPNDKGLLRPGMFVHLEQNVSMEKNALVIPQLAVVAGVKGYSVFKVVSQRALTQEITLGSRFKDKVVVASGLHLGDKIIVAGQDKVQDGSLVNIVAGTPQVQGSTSTASTPPGAVTAQPQSKAAAVPVQPKSAPVQPQSQTTPVHLGTASAGPQATTTKPAAASPAVGISGNTEKK